MHTRTFLFLPWLLLLDIYNLMCHGNFTDHATIVVKIDPDQVHSPLEAGTVLKGTVYLDVRASSIDYSALQLLFTGSEDTCIHYTTTSGSGKSRRTHHHYVRAHNHFWNTQVTLQQYVSIKAEKGNYEFPFECTIPQSAPSSMKSGIGKSSSKIEYTVSACLSRPGLFKWDVTDSKTFRVVAAPAHVQHAPLYMEPSFVSVKSCFCFDRGRMLTGGSSATSVLAAGENFRVNYAVQNESTAQIKSVEVALYESVVWHAGRRTRTSKRTLFLRNLSALPSHNETNLPDSALLATKKGDKEVNTDDDITQLRLIKSMLDSGRYATDIPILPDTRTSYNGSLIQVTHRLSITVRTSMGTANPEISCPVTIVRRHRPITWQSETSASNPMQAALLIPLATPVGWEPIQNIEEEKPADENIGLPSYWQAIQAPVYVVPMTYMSVNGQVVDSEGDADSSQMNAAMLQPSAPPPYLDYSIGGVNSLLTGLRNNFDRASELRKWLQHNSADNLQPVDYFNIFQAAAVINHQTQVAEGLSGHISQISCAHLGEACRGCNEFCRREVVEFLVEKATVVDKENKHLVQQYLSPFQFMCIERYFV